MNSTTRIQLDMAARVREFCRAHPADDPGYTGLVSRLIDRIDRAEALDTQERTGRLTATASVVSKSDLRSIIREHLAVLVSIAELMAKDQPGLDIRLRLPRARVNHQAFLTAARVILVAAAGERDGFIKQGMPATFLEDLTALVTRYQQAVADKTNARRSHVGANAALETTTSEIMLVVHLLDRLNRVRFRDDSELLAGWKSARDVAWPLGQKIDPAKGNGKESVA